MCEHGFTPDTRRVRYTEVFLPPHVAPGSGARRGTCSAGNPHLGPPADALGKREGDTRHNMVTFQPAKQEDPNDRLVHAPRVSFGDAVALAQRGIEVQHNSQPIGEK